MSEFTRVGEMADLRFSPELPGVLESIVEEAMREGRTRPEAIAYIQSLAVHDRRTAEERDYERTEAHLRWMWAAAKPPDVSAHHHADYGHAFPSGARLRRPRTHLTPAGPSR